LLDIYNVNVMDRTVAVEVLHQLRWEDARYFLSSVDCTSTKKLYMHYAYFYVLTFLRSAVSTYMYSILQLKMLFKTTGT
jgi:hypothetical protein